MANTSDLNGWFSIITYATQEEWEGTNPGSDDADVIVTLSDAVDLANSPQFSNNYEVVVRAFGEHADYETGETVFRRNSRPLMAGSSSNSGARKPVFENAERFDIPGRGPLFAVKIDRNKVDLRSLLNRLVVINGEDWYVTSIDHFSHNRVHIKDEPIGLVCRKPMPLPGAV